MPLVRVVLIDGGNGDGGGFVTINFGSHIYIIASAAITYCAMAQRDTLHHNIVTCVCAYVIFE